jgi:hypothetical protein
MQGNAKDGRKSAIRYAQLDQQAPHLFVISARETREEHEASGSRGTQLRPGTRDRTVMVPLSNPTSHPTWASDSSGTKTITHSSAGVSCCRCCDTSPGSCDRSHRSPHIGHCKIQNHSVCSSWQTGRVEHSKGVLVHIAPSIGTETAPT